MPNNPFRAHDIADRDKAIRDSIRAKAATRPKVDANGKPVDPPKLFRYDEFGQVIGPVDPEPPAA
jgi:hypothetical protein